MARKACSCARASVCDSVTHDGYTAVGTASWEGDGIPLFKLKIQNVVNNFEGCQIADMRALNHSTQVRINFGTKTCFEPPFVYEGPAEPRTCWTAKCSVDLKVGYSFWPVRFHFYAAPWKHLKCTRFCTVCAVRAWAGLFKAGLR